MGTTSYTTTATDIRKVAECFAADLSMLVRRTGTMDEAWAKQMARDIEIMAVNSCISAVSVELRNAFGHVQVAHRYDIQGDGDWDQDRPGGNNWPAMPEGYLYVCVTCSDEGIFANLLRQGTLTGWGDSGYIPNYSEMSSQQERQYSSNCYGWTRKTYVS